MNKALLSISALIFITGLAAAIVLCSSCRTLSSDQQTHPKTDNKKCPELSGEYLCDAQAKDLFTFVPRDSKIKISSEEEGSHKTYTINHEAFLVGESKMETWSVPFSAGGPMFQQTICESDALSHKILFYFYGTEWRFSRNKDGDLFIEKLALSPGSGEQEITKALGPEAFKQIKKLGDSFMRDLYALTGFEGENRKGKKSEEEVLELLKVKGLATWDILKQQNLVLKSSGICRRVHN